MVEEIVKCDRCKRSMNTCKGAKLLYSKRYIYLEENQYNGRTYRKDFCEECYKKLMKWMVGLDDTNRHEDA